MKRLARCTLGGIRDSISGRAITEDTRAGESGNLVAGRIAAVFDLHGQTLFLTQPVPHPWLRWLRPSICFEGNV